MADYAGGSSYDFTGQRQMAPMIAKARRGLQFGMTAYSPYENPAERDARARELLSGYGEALGNIGSMGVSAGLAEWSRVRAGEGRGSTTGEPVNQLRLMGLRDIKPSQYRVPSPTPESSGFKPEGYDVDVYGRLVPTSEKIKAMSPSQWSVGPGTRDPNWKSPQDKLSEAIRERGLYPNTQFVPPPMDPRGPVPRGYSSWAAYDAAAARERQLGTTYINTPFSGGGSSRPIGLPATGPGERFGPPTPTPTVYGAGSEEAYRVAMGLPPRSTLSSGRTY